MLLTMLSVLWFVPSVCNTNVIEHCALAHFYGLKVRDLVRDAESSGLKRNGF
jgi:hypothetical protein